MSGPLAGCRVLDLGIITAGAATSALLADLGAEVIKIESPTYADPFREWKANAQERDDGLRAYFRFTNRNKEGISIDLKQPQGRTAFLDLAACSNIVIENFRRGVLDQLGIGYRVLHATRPRIILASLSSQGEDGPDAGYVSFGTTLEAMGGLAWHTGYSGGPPTTSGRVLNYPDQVVAIFAAGMVLAAWRQGRRTGEGVHLDLSQRELTSFLVGEQFAASTTAPARAGNADGFHALQECFRTADGHWLAVSATEDQLKALPAPSGSEQGAAKALQSWIENRRGDEVEALLQARGVAAALVRDGSGTLADRGHYWHWALQSLACDAPVKGFPFQMQRQPLLIHKDAPRIGEDTAQVLRRVAGYSEEQIAALMRSGAISCGTSADANTST